MSMPPEKTLHAESRTTSLASSELPATIMPSAISRSMASLRRLWSGRLRVMRATVLSMRNFMNSNWLGWRRADWVVKSVALTGSIMVWASVGWGGARVAALNAENWPKLMLAQGLRGVGSGEIGACANSLRGAVASLGCEVFGAQHCCARTGESSVNRDDIAKSNEVIAARLMGATDAEEFPIEKAWVSAAPVRFDADWRGL